MLSSSHVLSGVSVNASVKNAVMIVPAWILLKKSLKRLDLVYLDSLLVDSSFLWYLRGQPFVSPYCFIGGQSHLPCSVLFSILGLPDLGISVKKNWDNPICFSIIAFRYFNHASLFSFFFGVVSWFVSLPGAVCKIIRFTDDFKFTSQTRETRSIMNPSEGDEIGKFKAAKN